MKRVVTIILGFAAICIVAAIIIATVKLRDPDLRTRWTVRGLQPSEVLRIELLGFDIEGPDPEANTRSIVNRDEIGSLTEALKTVPLSVERFEDQVNSLRLVLRDGGDLVIGFGACGRFHYFGREAGRVIEKYLRPSSTVCASTSEAPQAAE